MHPVAVEVRELFGNLYPNSVTSILMVQPPNSRGGHADRHDGLAALPGSCVVRYPSSDFDTCLICLAEVISDVRPSWPQIRRLGDSGLH